jgi:hypothetical protein
MYETALKPVVTYACEISSTNKVTLHMWERKILRKVYGPVLKQGLCRSRMNKEQKELYKTPDLVAGIKRRGLGYV